MKKVGENIRLNRFKKNLTQQQLSELTGISRTVISDVERGKKNITLGNLCLIAEALEVSVIEFLSQ